MNSYLYWVINIVFALILLIILANDCYVNKRPNVVEKKFRTLIKWVVFFCLQDMFWGLCQARIIKNDSIFFSSTSVFMVSTVVITFFWLDFIFTYLDRDVKYNKLYLALDGVLIIYELILVILNCSVPILFRIVDGEYVTEFLRPQTFMNQYIVYLVVGFVSLWVVLNGKTTDNKRKFLSVFVFSLTPILSGVFQFIYTDGPFYSMGYFLGCIMIHIFIVNKEREKNNYNTMIKAIADIYYSMHLFDLVNDNADRYIESDILKGLIADARSPQVMINRVMRGTVCEEYLLPVLEFVDLSTLPERMKGKNTISYEFIGKNFGWTRISFIVVEKDSESKPIKVMVVTQIIDDDKRKQLELLFASNNDDLTGLYNRRAYSNDMSEFKSKELTDNYVYALIDINGLKKTNDTLGHDAGDELIVGTANCLNNSFSKYGKIYRTGGDEFVASLFIESDKLDEVIKSFKDAVDNWQGVLVSELAVSCGFVSKSKNMTIDSMIKLADERMYEDKSRYYSTKGIDRRTHE